MDADPKERLRLLAESIEGLLEQERPFPTRSIPPDLGQWFVASVKILVESKEPDLAKALRKAFAIRGRGRPRSQVASKGARELGEKKKTSSWIKAADDLQRDPRGLQRKLDRFADRLDSERNAEVGKKIAEKIAGKPKPRPRRFPLG